MSPVQSSPEETFKAWAVKHGKVYADEAEYQKRFAIWTDNAQYVSEYNQQHETHWVRILSGCFNLTSYLSSLHSAAASILSCDRLSELFSALFNTQLDLYRDVQLSLLQLRWPRRCLENRNHGVTASLNYAVQSVLAAISVESHWIWLLLSHTNKSVGWRFPSGDLFRCEDKIAAPHNQLFRSQN